MISLEQFQIHIDGDRGHSRWHSSGCGVGLLRTTDRQTDILLRSSEQRFRQLVEQFRTVYDGLQGEYLCRAPGRVNLIGRIRKFFDLGVTLSSL